MSATPVPVMLANYVQYGLFLKVKNIDERLVITVEYQKLTIKQHYNEVTLHCYKNNKLHLQHDMYKCTSN